MLYVFDGGVLAPRDLDAVRLDPTELAEFAFHTVEESAAVLAPRLARRITSAVRARQVGRTLYLEHGTEPAQTGP
jgi:hypothetical protein